MTDAEVKPRKRVKWEPAALMLLVLFLGFWLALGPSNSTNFPTHPESTTQKILVAETRGVLETWRNPATSQLEFRVFTRDGHVSQPFSEAELRERFGESVVATATAPKANGLFRILGITSWPGLVWVGIGFLGQGVFASRFLVQWLVSEKRREAVIPESFWWMSLIGGVALFAYFAWRQDPVGVLGQSSGLVVYSRNLRLIYKQRRRERRVLDSDASSE
jgi:lipid-A-disaccharide synthase-like uncharacterized protein